MAAPGYVPPIIRGQRVRLNSGGPIMTAERVYDQVPHPFARCSWIDSWSRTHRQAFDLTSLEIVPWKKEDDSS